MAFIAVTVTIETAEIGHTDQIASELEKLGLSVQESLPELGVLCGNVEESRLPALRAAKGVAEARPEHGYKLPPLSGEVPQ